MRTIKPKLYSYSGVYHHLAAFRSGDYSVFSLLSDPFLHVDGFIPYFIYFCTYMYIYEYLHVFN